MDKTEKLILSIEKHKAKLAQLRNELHEQEKSSFDSDVFAQTIEGEYSMYCGDAVEVTSGLPSNSIHYSIFSPPFLSLYVYSDDPRDMGNSKTNEDFYTHFDYLITELFRVLKPGRLITLHTSLVPLTITRDGMMGVQDFPGALIRMFQQHGFIYHSKVNIWKDPLVQATRTKALSLAHKQISKDSTKCGMGFADELLTFRKPGENTEPVAHGRGFEEYIGELPEPKRDKNNNARENKYSHEVWQRYASPVWWDIKQSNTLNFINARENNDERHIVPLQLDVIGRCLELWTNKGDTVLSPFAGIGSEGYESLLRGRKFIGIELKESYYKSALKNLKKALNRPNKLI
jgi:DNA modification methylase